MGIFKNIKLTEVKIKDENWVAKVLKKRMMMPVYIAGVIVLLIILDATWTAYSVAQTIYKKNDRINNQIINTTKRIFNINNKIKYLKKDIEYISGTSLNSDAPIKLMTRVCQMLKDKEVIGSFYIKKRSNSSFNNVLNFEIQISYGDKDLLFVVSKIVLDKVFYLKDISRTKKGLKFELFKPSNEGNNEK